MKTNIETNENTTFKADVLKPSVCYNCERPFADHKGGKCPPELSEYDQQAETFLTSNGLKFRATLSDTKTPQWAEGEKHGHHYRVTISRPSDASQLYREAVDNFPQSMRPNRLVFDFWSSIADAEKGIETVKPYDVLACISGDVHTCDHFEGFCDEMGYERDSIKALQTFRRCSAFAKRLRAFFTPAELEQLSQIQ